MTTHTPAAAQEAVLTDDEILTATLYGQSEARMIRNGRAIESALLSKLRAPVADERAASFNPEDCSKEVYERGTYVGLFDIPKHVANELCVGISAATGARVDWHYFGGRVRVLALPAALASAPVAGEARDPVAQMAEDLLMYGLAVQRVNPAEFLAVQDAAEKGSHLNAAPQTGSSVAGEAQKPAAWMVYASDTHQLKRIVTTDPGDTAAFGCLKLPLYAAPQAGEAVRTHNEAIEAAAKVCIDIARQYDPQNSQENALASELYAAARIIRKQVKEDSAALSAQPGAQKGGSDVMLDLLRDALYYLKGNLPDGPTDHSHKADVASRIEDALKTMLTEKGSCDGH